MNDFETIREISGSGGTLAETARVCSAINDGLTRMHDALYGPEATDTLDASCNTCLHFQREKFDRKERLVSLWGFPGTCAKTGDKVTGWPRGQYCGNQCYENRRTKSLESSC